MDGWHKTHLQHRSQPPSSGARCCASARRYRCAGRRSRRPPVECGDRPQAAPRAMQRWPCCRLRRGMRHRARCRARARRLRRRAAFRRRLAGEAWEIVVFCPLALPAVAGLAGTQARLNRIGCPFRRLRRRDVGETQHQHAEQDCQAVPSHTAEGRAFPHHLAVRSIDGQVEAGSGSTTARGWRSGYSAWSWRNEN
jgi:hypothetical protein